MLCFFSDEPQNLSCFDKDTSSVIEKWQAETENICNWGNWVEVRVEIEKKDGWRRARAWDPIYSKCATLLESSIAHIYELFFIIGLHEKSTLYFSMCHACSLLETIKILMRIWFFVTHFGFVPTHINEKRNTKLTITSSPLYFQCSFYVSYIYLLNLLGEKLVLGFEWRKCWSQLSTWGAAWSPHVFTVHKNRAPVLYQNFGLNFLSFFFFNKIHYK
jgi:hypothetical protein